MKRLKRKEYEALLEPMQQELAAMARWLQQSGRRVVVLFESVGYRTLDQSLVLEQNLLRAP